MTDYAERAKLIAALINQTSNMKQEDEYDLIDRADFIANFVRGINAVDPKEEQRKRLGIDPTTVPFLSMQQQPSPGGFDPAYTTRNLMQQQGLTESGMASLGRGIGVGLAETANVVTNVADLVAGSDLTQKMDYQIEEFFGAHGELNKAPISKVPYFIGKMLGMLPSLVGASRAAGATIGSVNAIRKLGFTNPTVARAIMAAAEGSYQEMFMENPDPKSMLGFAALDWGLRWRRAGVAMSEALRTSRAKTMGGLTKYFDTQEIRWFREAEVGTGALPDDFWWDFGRALRKSTEGTNTADILKTIARPLIARHVGNSMGNVELVVNNSRSAKSVFVVLGSGETLNVANDGDLLKLMDVMLEGEDHIAKMIGPEALINELKRTLTAQTPEEIETLFKIGASGVEHEVQAGVVAGAKREIGVVLEDVKTGTEMFVTQTRLASDPKYRRGIYDGQFVVRRVMHVSADAAEQEKQLDDMLKTVFGRRYGSDIPGVYMEGGVGSNEVIVRFRLPNPAGDGYVIEEVSVPMTRTSYRTPSGEVKTSEDILGFGGQVHHTGGGPEAWVDGVAKLKALRAMGAEVFEVRVPNLADARTRRVIAQQLTSAGVAPQRGRNWWRRNAQTPTSTATTNTVATPFGTGTPMKFESPAGSPPPVRFDSGTPTPFDGGTGTPMEFGGVAGAPNFGRTSPGAPDFGTTSPGAPAFGATSPGAPVFGSGPPPPPAALPAQAGGPYGARAVVDDIDMERRWMEERSAQLGEEARVLNEELSKMPDLTTPEAKAKLDELQRIIEAKNEFDEEIYRRLNPGAEGRPDVTGLALPATTTTGEVPTRLGPGGGPSGPATPMPPRAGGTPALPGGEPVKALPAGKAPGPRATATLVAHEARLGVLLEDLNKQKLSLQAAIRRGDIAWIKKTFGTDMSPGDLMGLLDDRIASVQKELAQIRVGLVEVTDDMKGGVSLVSRVSDSIKAFFSKVVKGKPSVAGWGVPAAVEGHPLWGVLRSDHLQAVAAAGKAFSGSHIPAKIEILPGAAPTVHVLYTSGDGKKSMSFFLIQRGSELHELDDLFFTGMTPETPIDALGWQLVTREHVTLTAEQLAKMPEKDRDLLVQRVKILVETLYNRNWALRGFPATGKKAATGPNADLGVFADLITSGNAGVDSMGRVWINPTFLQKVPTAKSALPEFLAKYLARRSKGVDPWIATFLARADRGRMGQWVRGEGQTPMSEFEAKLRAAVASDMENGYSTHDAGSATMALRSQDPKLFATLMQTHTERTAEIGHLDWIEERAKALLRTGQAQKYSEAIEKAVRQLGYDMDLDTQKQLFGSEWHASTLPGAVQDDPMKVLGGWREESANIWATIMDQADAWLVKRDDLARIILKARALSPMTPQEMTIMKEHILPMLDQWMARSRVTEDFLEYMDVREQRKQFFELLKTEVERGTMGLDDYLIMSEFFATLPKEVMEQTGTTFEWVRQNMRVAMEFPTAVEHQPRLMDMIRKGAFVPTQMELYKDKGWVNVRRLNLHSDGTVSGEFLALAKEGEKGSKWMPFDKIRLEQTRMAGWNVPGFSGLMYPQRSAGGMANFVIRLMKTAGLTGLFHEHGHIAGTLIPPQKMQFIAEQLGNWMAIQAARAMKTGQKLPEMSQQLTDLARAIDKAGNAGAMSPLNVNLLDPTELVAEFLGRRMADVTKYVRSTTMDVPIQHTTTRHAINKTTLMANRDADLRFTTIETEAGAYESSTDVHYEDTITREAGEVPLLRAMDSEVPQREARVVGPYDELDPRLEGALDDDLARGGDTQRLVRTEPAGGPPRESARLEEGYPKVVEQRGLARSWRVGRRRDPLFVEGATQEQIDAANSLYVYLKTANNAMWGQARPEDKALFASIDALLDDMFDPISKHAMSAEGALRAIERGKHPDNELDRLTYDHIQNFWGVAPAVLTRNLGVAIQDAQNTKLAYVLFRDYERYRRSMVQLDRYSSTQYSLRKDTVPIFGIQREDGSVLRYWTDDYDEAWRVRQDLTKKGENATILVQSLDKKALAKYEVFGDERTGFSFANRADDTVTSGSKAYRSPTRGKAQFRYKSEQVDPRSTRGKLWVTRSYADAASAKDIKAQLAKAGWSNLVYDLPDEELDGFLEIASRHVHMPGWRVQRMPIAAANGKQRESLVLVREVPGGGKKTKEYEFHPLGVTLTKTGKTTTAVEISSVFSGLEKRSSRRILPPEIAVDDEFADLYKVTSFDTRLFGRKMTLATLEDGTPTVESTGMAKTAQDIWDNIAHHHMVFGKTGVQGFGLNFNLTGIDIKIPDEVRTRMSAIGMTEEDMLNGYHGAEEQPSVFGRMVRATNRFAQEPGISDEFVNVDLKPPSFVDEQGNQIRRRWLLHAKASGVSTQLKADYENQEALHFYFKYNGQVDRMGVSSTHDIPMILMHQAGPAPQVFVRAPEAKTFTWYLQSGNQADEAKDLIITTDHAFVLPSGNPGDDVLKGALPTEVVNAIDLGFKLRGAIGPFGQGNMGEAVASHLKRQAIGRFPDNAKPLLDAAGLWSLRRLAAGRGLMMRVTAEGIEFIRPGLATATGEWAQPVVRLARTVGDIRDILGAGEADAFLDTNQLNEMAPLVSRMAEAAQEATPHVDPANPQADANATGLQAYLRTWNEKLLTVSAKWNYLLGNMHRLTGILEEKTGIPIWRLYQRAHEGWQSYEAERVTRIKVVAEMIGDMDDEEQRLITHWLDMGAFREDLPDVWKARLAEFESRYAPALTPRVREKAAQIRQWFDTMYSEFEPGYGKDTVPAEIAYAPWLRHKASGMAERAAQSSPQADKDPIDFVVGTPWFHHARLNAAWDPMYDDRIGSLMSKYLDTAVRHKHLRPISMDFVDAIKAIESMRNEFGAYDKVELAYAVRTLRHINNIVTGNYGPGTVNFYGGMYKILSKLVGSQRLAKFITENMVTYGISSGLGFRPGSAIRNLIYAPLPVFSLLGGRHLGVGMKAMTDFMRGNADPDFVRFVDKEKNTYLENWMGDALDNFQRITVGRVPTSERIPAEFMRRSLVLQEKTEVFNRGFSFFAGVSSGREIFGKWGGRTLDEANIRQLLDESPLGVFHAAEQKYLLEALQANDEVAFVQRYANSVVRFTQFTYGPFEGFRAANNKVGKLGFFFGSWTMNQAGMVAAFLRRTWTADGRVTGVNRNGLKYAMRFMGGTVAGYEALKMMGLDPDTTFAFTPTGYAGSPYMQTGIDLIDWFRTTGHRKELARNQFYTRLTQVFTPGGAVMSDVIKGIDDIKEDEYWHATGHVIFGTTPTDEAKAAEKGKYTHWAPTAPKRILHGMGFIKRPKMYDTKNRTFDELAASARAARSKKVTD